MAVRGRRPPALAEGWALECNRGIVEANPRLLPRIPPGCLWQSTPAKGGDSLCRTRCRTLARSRRRGGRRRSRRRTPSLQRVCLLQRDGARAVPYGATCAGPRSPCQTGTSSWCSQKGHPGVSGYHRTAAWPHWRGSRRRSAGRHGLGTLGAGAPSACRRRCWEPKPQGYPASNSRGADPAERNDTIASGAYGRLDLHQAPVDGDDEVETAEVDARFWSPSFSVVCHLKPCWA